MKLEKYNQIMGEKFIDALNKEEAEMRFAFGLTKDRRVKIWFSEHLPKEDLKEILSGIILELDKK